MVRKEPQSCVYACSRGPKPAAASDTVKAKHAESMQERIDRLEILVTSLASQSQKSGDLAYRTVQPNLIRPSPIGGVPLCTAKDHAEFKSEISHGSGVLNVNENHTLYRGTTHWGDVFQEVSS
jgi:hypothetical protein